MPENLSINEAKILLDNYIKNDKLKKHSLAVAEIMVNLAEFLKIPEKEEWYLIGLLHDLDFESTKDDPKKHGLITAEILKGKMSEDSINAIKNHNFENLMLFPSRKVDFALICSDAISGLIIACMLVMPNKKLEEVTVKTILQKFKQKDFAKNISRERILFCEKLGIPLENFVEISLTALKNISEKLG
ncbi:MAG: HDIG domain-containing protein [archaeon]